MSLRHRFWIGLVMTAVLFAATVAQGAEARCRMETTAEACCLREAPVLVSEDACDSCMAPATPDLQTANVLRNAVDSAPAADAVVGASVVAAEPLSPVERRSIAASPPVGVSLSIRLRVLRI